MLAFGLLLISCQVLLASVLCIAACRNDETWGGALKFLEFSAFGGQWHLAAPPDVASQQVQNIAELSFQVTMESSNSCITHGDRQLARLAET